MQMVGSAHLLVYPRPVSTTVEYPDPVQGDLPSVGVSGTGPNLLCPVQSRPRSPVSDPSRRWDLSARVTLSELGRYTCLWS